MLSFKQFLFERKMKGGWGMHKPGRKVLPTATFKLEKVLLLHAKNLAAFEYKTDHTDMYGAPSPEWHKLNGKFIIMIARTGNHRFITFNIIHPVTLRNLEPDTFSFEKEEGRYDLYEIA